MKKRLLKILLLSCFLLLNYEISIAAVSVSLNSVTNSSNSNGLSPSPLYPQYAVVLYGLGVTVSGGSTSITKIVIPSGFSNCNTLFTNGKLYHSISSTYDGTASPIASAVIPGTSVAIGTNTITVTGISDVVSNTTEYYYLVLDYTYTGGSSFSANAFNNPVVTYSTGNATNYAGSPFYSLNPNTVVATANTSGVTAGGPITYSQTTSVYGFSMSINGLPTVITGFRLNDATGNTLQNVFGNGKIYRSTSSIYDGTAVQIAGAGFSGNVAFSGSTVNVSGLSETISNTPTYYYLIINDIYYGTSGNFQPVLNQITTSGGSASYNVYGNYYSFKTPPPTVVLTGNNTAANGITQGSLQYGQNGIVLFSFKLDVTGITNINRFIISSTGAGNTWFNTGALYRSTNPNYSVGTPVNVGSVSWQSTYASINVNEAFNTYLTTTTYYYFLLANYDNNNANASGTVKYGFSTSQNPLAIGFSDGSYANPNAVNDGQTFNVGVSYDWAGSYSSSTSFSDPANYRNLNGGDFTTPPGTYDQVRIGVVPYAKNGTIQPNLTGSLTIGNLILGNNNNPILTINTGQTLTSNNGVTLVASTTATITSAGTGTLTLPVGSTSIIPVNSTLNLTGSAKLNNSGIINQTGTLSIAGASVNLGTINQSGSGGLTFSGTLNNTGTITQSSTGTITFTGAVTNNSGGIITQTGAGIANFAADVTNSSGGILTPGAGTGTSNFAGTTITNNSATPITFNNVNINNSISLAGSGTFSVNNTGTLTVATGKIFAAGTNMLRLKSGASGSAAVGPLAGTSAITGSVNVERWVTGGASATYRGYRLISSPVNISGAATGNIDLGYINNTSNSNGLGALIGGPGGSTNGFDLDIANPSVYVYREDWTATSTGFNGGKHKGITKINSTGATSNVAIATGATTAASANYTIPAGTGYIFYDIGSTAQPGNQAAGSNPASFAITAKGYLNQGTIPVKNWFTPASNYLSYTGTTSAGYNMLGNPYAAPIDLNKVISLNPKIANFIYELSNDNSAGQVYKAYKSTGGSDPTTSRYILSGQGFIVKATDATTTFSFTESMKDLSGTQVPLLLSTAPLPDDQIAGFYMKMEQDSTIGDYCGIYFSKNWSDAYDQEDAIDLDGASPKVYMSSYTSDTRRTAINDLSDYKGGKTIKLYVNAIADGIYKLKIEQIKNIDPLYDIWLKDNFKKDSLDFRNNSTYSFNVARSDATTFGADRFTLVIRRKVLPAYQFISLKGSLSGPAINLTWKAQNEYNFTGFIVEKLNAANQYDALTYIQSNGSGTYSYVDKTPYTGVNTYRIKQDDIDSKISYSTAVSVNTIKTNPQNGKFMIYPNPAATTTLNIQFVDSFTGSVNVMVANSSGTVISQQVFTQQQGTIDISRLKTGVYFIKAASQQSGQEIGSEGFIKL